MGRSRPRTGRREFYETFVSAVDADGNETAGIRLPPIAVPLGTYTGLERLSGAALRTRRPRRLAHRRSRATRAEREAADDPRPSLEERYGSREAYVAQVRRAAAALVAERLLLPADAEAFIAAAKESAEFGD